MSHRNAARLVKTCFKCGLQKSLTEFYRHSQMADGHLNKCKTCARRDARNTRASRPEYYRHYDRRRSKLPHRIAKAKQVIARWAKARPARRAAQVALGNAVRAGIVVSWPVCALHDCDANPEAHHPNYDAPLDVVWLCPAHHKQAHALVRLLEEAA